MRTMSHYRKHQYEKSLGRNRTEFKLPTNFLQISVQLQHFIKSTSFKIFKIFLESCWFFFFKKKKKGKDTHKKMSNSNPVLLLAKYFLVEN